MKSSFTAINIITSIGHVVLHSIAVVVAAIGMIMILSPALRLLLGFTTPSYSSPGEQFCHHTSFEPYGSLEECIHEAKREESEQYIRRQQEQILNGLVVLFVGAVLFGFAGSVYTPSRSKKPTEV